MLHTKLHRHPVTREHVYRDHLIDLLDENIYKPVTLVSAGAGYGKSMLLSSWLEKCESPYAWISLNSDDEELADVADDSMSLGFDIDFLKFFYFVPVALLLAVIYPVVYILFYWPRFKMQLTKMFHSIIARIGH